jgi:hypothetical protein
MDYSQIKTIIYTPTGYFGSPHIWNDASYAFQHRHDNTLKFRPYGTLGAQDRPDDWIFLGNDSVTVANNLNVNLDVIPEYDYEVSVLGDFK